MFIMQSNPSFEYADLMLAKKIKLLYSRGNLANCTTSWELILYRIDSSLSY